ncbi:hypothetical protein NDU88_002741 [Pleurodeles waltl]|uniref:Uncharacterized protein n=1 Tax=Pleurodeles waltl TaxID=8319 RepID=A0AAV7T399_PLEWA|nr:hypothetical protein NDU88_002741 [Pleurodeles waltl]
MRGKHASLGTPPEAWEWIEMRGLLRGNGLGKEGAKAWTAIKRNAMWQEPERDLPLCRHRNKSRLCK